MYLLALVSSENRVSGTNESCKNGVLLNLVEYFLYRNGVKSNPEWILYSWEWAHVPKNNVYLMSYVESPKYISENMKS